MRRSAASSPGRLVVGLAVAHDRAGHQRGAGRAYVLAWELAAAGRKWVGVRAGGLRAGAAALRAAGPAAARRPGSSATRCSQGGPRRPGLDALVEALADAAGHGAGGFAKADAIDLPDQTSCRLRAGLIPITAEKITTSWPESCPARPDPAHAPGLVAGDD